MEGVNPSGAWCRAFCGAALDPKLIDRIDGSGLHQTCMESGPPLATVRELGLVLMDYEASRPRSRQTRLGPSELGVPCDQQLARKLAGMPRKTASAPAWAPLQGTAMHRQMEEVLGYWNERSGYLRWYIEDELSVDAGTKAIPPLTGVGDAFDRDYGMVVDWKLVGTSTLNKIKQARTRCAPVSDQVSAQYRVQAHLYGFGHLRKGRDVKWVRLVFLARTHKFADSLEWTEAFDPEVALEAIARYHTLHELVSGLDLANNPQLISLIKASPGDGCTFCPFHNPAATNETEGCQGDVALNQRYVDKFEKGLIT